MRILPTTFSRRCSLPSPKTIGRFGRALLVRCPDGQLQLRGGCHADYLAALEWVSLFLPEAVLMPEVGLSRDGDDALPYQEKQVRNAIRQIAQ